MCESGWELHYWKWFREAENITEEKNWSKTQWTNLDMIDHDQK